MVRKKQQAAKFRAAYIIEHDSSRPVESLTQSRDPYEETPDHETQKVELTSENSPNRSMRRN